MWRRVDARVGGGAAEEGFVSRLQPSPRAPRVKPRSLGPGARSCAPAPASVRRPLAHDRLVESVASRHGSPGGVRDPPCHAPEGAAPGQAPGPGAGCGDVHDRGIDRGETRCPAPRLNRASAPRLRVLRGRGCAVAGVSHMNGFRSPRPMAISLGWAPGATLGSPWPLTQNPPLPFQPPGRRSMDPVIRTAGSSGHRAQDRCPGVAPAGRSPPLRGDGQTPAGARCFTHKRSVDAGSTALAPACSPEP